MRQTLIIIAARWSALSKADVLLWLLVVPLLVLALAESFGPWIGVLGLLALALLVAKSLAAFFAWVDRGDPGDPPPSPRKRRKKPGGGGGGGGAPVFAALRPRPVLGAAAAKELPMEDDGDPM